jgi:hypothetical protein
MANAGKTITMRYTHAWVKNNEVWHLVARQAILDSKAKQFDLPGRGMLNAGVSKKRYPPFLRQQRFCFGPWSQVSHRQFDH